MAPIASRYTPIWITLKQKGTATIVAERKFHRRLIKAVQARRDKDILFKYQLEEAGKKHRITWKITGNTIVFTLTLRVSINGI
jgi:hypothetical protein